MLDRLLEKDLIPDILIRAGIRRLLAQRLRDCGARHTFNDMADLPALVARLCQAHP